MRISLHKRSGQTGRVIASLSREEVGWDYVSFAVWNLEAGDRLDDSTGEEEVGLVVLSGIVSVESDAGTWLKFGERASVFEGSPHVLYLPPGNDFTIVAETSCQIARAGSLTSAGTEATTGAYLVTPEEISIEARGEGGSRRTIRHLLEADRPARNLFLVECITPDGNWSSYPPHKHDTSDFPRETYLEETYYHRIQPSQGFGFQRVYSADGSQDEAIVIQDGSIVAVHAGYHPVTVAPGYELYYLNVMAGPIREWHFTNDPDHAWIAEAWKPYAK